MKWNSNFIEDSERKIHFYHNSNTENPPLILLHGVTDNGLCWTPIANVLAKKYYVIMPDARGHGFTETANEAQYSHDLMADDVAFLIQKLQLKNPQIIGHSMGANVATVVNAKYPDLIHKTVLEDPAFIIQKFRWYIKPIAYLVIKIMNWISLRGSFEAIMKKGKNSFSNWPAEVFKPWAEAKIQYREKNKHFLLGILKIDFLWKEYLKSVKCPILILSSSKGILSDKKAKEALELCTTASWVKIEGAGHNIRREQPEEFLKAVKDFLD
ncbi:MAG: alpha/beta fold hydrolase [Promethearchaeota archaeon]